MPWFRKKSAESFARVVGNDTVGKNAPHGWSVARWSRRRCTRSAYSHPGARAEAEPTAPHLA